MKLTLQQLITATNANPRFGPMGSLLTLANDKGLPPLMQWDLMLLLKQAKEKVDDYMAFREEKLKEFGTIIEGTLNYEFKDDEGNEDPAKKEACEAALKAVVEAAIELRGKQIDFAEFQSCKAAENLCANDYLQLEWLFFVNAPANSKANKKAAGK